MGVLLPAGSAWGQGCIVARSSSQSIGPESQGGYLEPGDWETTINYRHQYSFRHFVGSTEQVNRIQLGNQVMNKINLENFGLTYQATSRFSFTLNVPVLLASRRSNNAYSTTHAQGLGDASFIAQGWLWNPKRAKRGNIAIGLGLSAPTGRDHVVNNIISTPGATPTTVPVDYSIQPGTGGWGMVLQWQAFKAVGPKSVFYFNGNYVATPQNTNNFLRSATSANQPLTAYNSISDQYLLEAGVAYPIEKIRGLTFTFGLRDEGVPASDLIGDSLGFRRPGFAVSTAPGFVYAHGRSMVTASVGKAIYRNRTRSVPDKILGTHGDAAFADYVWFLSYTFRLPGKMSTEH